MNPRQIYVQAINQCCVYLRQSAPQRSTDLIDIARLAGLGNASILIAFGCFVQHEDGRLETACETRLGDDAIVDLLH